MPIDPGNTRRQATLLNASSQFKNTIGVKDKFDFFRLNLTSRSSFQVTLGRLQSNADLALYRNNKLLAHSKRSGKKKESIATTLNAGTYYLRVSGSAQRTSYLLTTTAICSSLLMLSKAALNWSTPSPLPQRMETCC